MIHGLIDMSGVNMELKVFLTVCLTVFIAELGDKTQLATMAFATNREVSAWMIFFAASVGLTLAAGLGVIAGSTLSEFINPRMLAMSGGVLFLVIGAITIYKALQLP